MKQMNYATMYMMVSEFSIVEMTEMCRSGEAIVGYTDSRLGRLYVNTAFIFDKEGWIYTIGVFKDAYCEEAICLMQVTTNVDGSCPVIAPLDEEQYLNCSGIPEEAMNQRARRL